MSEPSIEEGLRSLLDPTVQDGEPCSEDLYRFASGEASQKEAAAFREHLAGCPLCQADLKLFEKQTETGEETRSPVFRFALAGALVLVPLILVLAGILWWTGSQPADPDAGYRIKGPYSLQVAVQRGSERFVAKSGDRFEDGDILGFFYTAPTESTLVILFSDQEGKITRIHPMCDPGLLAAGVEVPLPDGAIIEPGAGCEWIVGFFSVQPIQLEQLRKALRNAVAARKKGCELPAMELEGVSVDAIIMRRD